MDILIFYEVRGILHFKISFHFVRFTPTLRIHNLFFHLLTILIEFFYKISRFTDKASSRIIPFHDLKQNCQIEHPQPFQA